MRKFSAGARDSVCPQSAVNRGYCVRCSCSLLGGGARWYIIIVNTRTYYVGLSN